MLDSRAIREGDAIRRRRECLGCARRFTTYEQIEERRLMVAKKDGRREPFEREKILRGLHLACMKRPVSTETLERLVDAIERELHDAGTQEVASEVIGERIVRALHELDPVAYVRFASVYRNFHDVTQFGELVDRFARPAARRRSPGRGKSYNH